MNRFGFLFKNDFTRIPVRLLKVILLNLKLVHKNVNISVSSTSLKVKYGKHIRIYSNVNLAHVQIGDFTYVSERTTISTTTIGKFCSIGPGCRIGLGIHPSSEFISTHPVFFSSRKQSGITFSQTSLFQEQKKIIIGNDVWIGANVIIKDGVKIADGAIIAAGAVVVRDVQAYSIVGGVPAKHIRYRYDKQQINALLNFKWWDLDILFLKKNYTLFTDIINLEKLKNEYSKH